MPETRPAAPWLLPLSIVFAGALVGLGLFLGLRTRAPEPAAAASGFPPGIATNALASSSAAGDPSVLGVASAALAGEPPAAQSSQAVAPVDLEKVAAAAKKELEKLRTAVVQACVAPALKAQPTPSTLKYTFNFSFGRDGKQIGRGVIEDRATSRPEVTQCMLGKLVPISVPPPGEPVRVDVPWTLP